ncbi:sulfide/dihydroorotate dehydrogenase-like FAD/NAD-binding protein [Chloroflexota bacterium]
MYKILLREDLAPNIHLFTIAAPAVAKKAQPGQFVIVRVDEKGERIPLTIADWDREEGSVTIVFNEVGRTTHKLAALKAGDFITNFVGPLGLPAHIEKFGTVACVAEGYSVATIVPIVRALKEAGNKVISIIRAPSEETLFGEERLRGFSNQLIIITGDGSFGLQGFIFEPLRELLENEKVDRVITIGPACVMKLCAATTRPFEVKTIVSLNPIMVDGTGMCGCCRVIVGGVTKFACVDGPEFDAHEVDWDLLMARRCTYSSETQSMLQYQCRNCAQW